MIDQKEQASDISLRPPFLSPRMKTMTVTANMNPMDGSMHEHIVFPAGRLWQGYNVHTV